MKKLLSLILTLTMIVGIFALVPLNAGTAKITVTTKAKNSKGKKLKKTLTLTVKKAKVPSSDTQEKAYVAEYQDLVKSKMEELGFNGVVRVSKNDVVICELANGTVSSDSKKKITLDNQFGIGSVSKQFTAACIMLLKEAGELSVDDTIDKWFPEYEHAGEITVKNLLSMRSGIRDYVNASDSEEEYYSRYNYSSDASGAENRKATRDWIFSKDLLFKPDTRIRYSNSNYFLLAEIVEKVSGTSLSSFLKKNIFTPLKMNDTGPGEDLVSSARLLAPVKGEYPAEIYAKGIAFGDGGIVSTAADMDKWMISLREHTILSEESIAEMTTDHSPTSSLHYGYGIVLLDDGVWMHEGEIDTYLTHMLTAPAEKYNLFISTNSNDHQDLNALAKYVQETTRK